MIAIVCPSNRPDRLAVWRDAWRHEFTRPDVKVYVVLDSEDTRDEIDQALGYDAWIIPWHTGAIRSWGTLKAYWDGADYFIHLDDDCLPNTPHFVDSHIAALKHPSQWVSTIRGLVPRGMPRDPSGSSVVVNHGLWTNIPDLDGETQLATPPPYVYETPTQWMPAGMYFPLSYMNVAFTREIAPTMWLGLQGCRPDGTKWGFDRFDDIWCGVLTKRVCDHLGLTIRSGTPLVRHDRASNPVVNAELERPGVVVNEWFWREVESTPLTARAVPEAYEELAAKLDLPDETYWEAFRDGMLTWVRCLGC